MVKNEREKSTVPSSSFLSFPPPPSHGGHPDFLSQKTYSNILEPACEKEPEGVSESSLLKREGRERGERKMMERRRGKKQYPEATSQSHLFQGRSIKSTLILLSLFCLSSFLVPILCQQLSNSRYNNYDQYNNYHRDAYNDRYNGDRYVDSDHRYNGDNGYRYSNDRYGDNRYNGPSQSSRQSRQSAENQPPIPPTENGGVSPNQGNQNNQSQSSKNEKITCYDHRGKAQRCVPGFVNAAFGRHVEVTNTCGERGPSMYCLQTGPSQEYTHTRTCSYCDSTNASLAHPSTHLTDFHDIQTWWQSDTMYDGVGNPTITPQVNLTLNLGKRFAVNYIRLKFYSPRPESFAIYKKTQEKDDWIPFQYYSGHNTGMSGCLTTYGVKDRDYVTRDNETKALCTSEYSDISPLTGGNVVFTTLAGRASANDFENSPQLQQFVTANAIRITLDRLNTFGDEIFGDENVLRSYFYGIYDLSVGGICKCNGHASECVSSDPNDPDSEMVCQCEHYTDGPDCERCLPFYNDQPWSRATANDAHECKPCNCNGHSSRCYFDQELWQKTGHGGHCLDCNDNRDGPNCERCKENYYENSDGHCVACNCDPTGSLNLQCNSQGQCICKPGVDGQRCDHCADNHYDFSPQGCKSCGCNVAGSWNNTGTCDTVTGQCRCKANVEGQHCDLCKPGHFDLQTDNEFGCLPCFCYGHSSVCMSAQGFSKYSIDSLFSRDTEKWTAATRSGQEVPFQYNAITKNLGVKASDREAIYFLAPEKYLGDQKSSYNQYLSFSLRIGEEGGPRATFEDISLEGAGMTISQPIFGQGNPLPSTKVNQYKFRLHEDAIQFGWSPRLRAKDFISVLANLTAIKIRATYTYEGTGFIDDVRLDSAQSLPFGQRATWVEMCTCPQGYVGQFCESCAPGYRHNPPGGGSHAECIPCNCNGHTDLCDAETGECICQDNTGGTNCEKCADGYYGNALKGTKDDCQECQCPDRGPCVVLPDEVTVSCLTCPPGYGGHKCDVCVDGYYGDPHGPSGISRICQECKCNGNIDPNAIGNCNTTSGECMRCIFNTHGSRCEKCLPGFYGDALAMPKGNCKPCSCDHKGTRGASEPAGNTYDTALPCEQVRGQCNCKPNVMGRQCDRCVEGFYNLVSGNGCDPCNCNLIGSYNRTCDQQSGQCYCRPGITGRHCDQCLPLHYGFSTEGCKHCDCDRIGSTGPQCDERGQCPCKPNVEGRRCERCRENKHDKQAGCVDCPICYNLIQDAVNEHRIKVSELQNILDEIERNPQVVEDAGFNLKLTQVTNQVDSLLRDAIRAQGADGSLTAQLENLKQRIMRVKGIASDVKSRLNPIEQVVGQGEKNITMAEEIIDRAQDALQGAKRVLEVEGWSALEKARERSKKFGQQSERMSEIARQARQMADKHEIDSVTIEKLAREAIATSEEAYKLALDAIQAQEKNRLELERLETQLDETSELMLRTRKMADEARKEATKAYNDTLAIFSDLKGVVVPELESDKLRVDALELIVQAERILKEAFDLINKNSGTLNNTASQQLEARDLLAEAARQQKITDELLVDTFSAFSKANESIASGEATLDDAKKTLETLQKFDRLIAESKGKADEALARVEEITRMIEEAERKTDDAEGALRGALNDAIEARDVAIEAQRIAEKASEDSDRIRSDADSTKARATSLKSEADRLNSAIDETGGRMKEFEDQATNDEKLAKDALERANQAKTSAFDADTKVKNSMETVRGILASLNDVQDIDGDLLADLEKRLQEAEQELKNADLDNRLNILKAAREAQHGWVRNYDAEIERLKKDVANIQDIRYAIPDQCFRRVRLEP